MRPEGYNPKRVWIEDKDCERMTRNEMNAVKMVYALLSYVAFDKKDLAKRLNMIPYGKRRFAMAMGALKSIYDDIMGTASYDQTLVFVNTMADHEVRLMPKMTPVSVSVILSKEDAKMLIDSARVRCTECTADGTSCRECNLYRFLEANVPLDDYGNGLMCPYWGQKFEN